MNIAIIGGGASGLVLACMLCMRGEKPIVYEKQARVGRKLLSTGNGRCNFTNLNADVKHYHGDAGTVKAVLDRFTPWDAMDLFSALGLESSADEEGRVYPLSNQAAGVLDALRMYAVENGAELRTDSQVTAITRAGRRFSVKTNDSACNYDAIVIACGGLAAPKLGAGSDGYTLLKGFGHTVTPRYPAIVALKTPVEPIRGLKGIRMHGRIELFVDGKLKRGETGEILFSETGISGIAAMQLAREVNLALARDRKCVARMNFFPEAEKGFMRDRVRRLPLRATEDILSGIVPKRLGQALITAAGIRPVPVNAGDLTDRQAQRIEAVITGWELPVTGTLPFENAQVTCGGVPLSEFNRETLCSNKVDGLYAIGEVLDVDGDCGGFNLHWAWASANTVALALAGEYNRQ